VRLALVSGERLSADTEQIADLIPSVGLVQDAVADLHGAWQLALVGRGEIADVIAIVERPDCAAGLVLDVVRQRTTAVGWPSRLGA
jgi:hypothetical protein